METAASLAGILGEIGALMRECHRESLALQDALADGLAGGGASPDGIRTFQNLDHLTQIQDDLARLMPALSAALLSEGRADESLPATVRLASLRCRLFGGEAAAGSSLQAPGDVNFF